MLVENKIKLSKDCNFSNIYANFKSYPEKYSLVYSKANQLLPYTHCSKFNFFRFYKIDPHQKVRNNSISNVVNHKCKSSGANPNQPLMFFAPPVEMSLEMRQKRIDVIAQLVSEHPTMSTSCAVDFANKLLGVAQTEILKINRPVIYDFNRKSVGKKIIEIGLKKRENNLKYLNEHLDS